MRTISHRVFDLIEQNTMTDVDLNKCLAITSFIPEGEPVTGEQVARLLAALVLRSRRIRAESQPNGSKVHHAMLSDGLDLTAGIG